jgi:WD40 repeat protein
LLLLVVTILFSLCFWLLVRPGVPSLMDNLSRDQTLTGGGGGIARSVAFGGDGSLVAAGDDSGTVAIWNTQDGTRHGSALSHGAYLKCLAFSPSGKLLASGGADRCVKIWDVVSNELVKNLGPLEASISTAAFSPDGSSLLCATDGGDEIIRRWDLSTWEEAVVLKKADSTSLTNSLGVNQIGFTPDGKSLAVGVDTGVLLWSLTERSEQAFLPARLMNFSISADGRVLALANGLDVNVNLWDLDSLSERSTFAPASAGSSPQFVSSLALAPSGRFLIVSYAAIWGDREVVVLWDVEGNPREVATARIPRGDFVSQLAFSPNGRVIASASATGTRLWDASAIVKPE